MDDKGVVVCDSVVLRRDVWELYGNEDELGVIEVKSEEVKNISKLF